MNLFTSLDEVRLEADRWLTEYNTEQPHKSLRNMTPVEFLVKKGHADLATYTWR